MFHRKALSIQKMRVLTSTTDCVPVPEDDDVYLAWNDMKFNVIGNKITENTQELDNICTTVDHLYRILFPGKTTQELASSSENETFFLLSSFSFSLIFFAFE